MSKRSEAKAVFAEIRAEILASLFRGKGWVMLPTLKADLLKAGLVNDAPGAFEGFWLQDEKGRRAWHVLGRLLIEEVLAYGRKRQFDGPPEYGFILARKHREECVDPWAGGG